MQVLQTPLTWIIAAGVLLVVAVVLLALGHHRRVRADREATEEAAVTGPVAVAAAGAPRSEGLRGAPAGSRYSAAPRTGPHAATAGPRPGPAPVTGPRPAPAPTVPGPGAAPDGADAPHRSPRHAGPPHATTEPEPVREARADRAADATAAAGPSTREPGAGRRRVEDRLLAAVVRDPDEAVRALVGLEDGEPLGRAAGRLLRAGLTPAQVAELCDVAPADLASVVATDLGLLPAATPVDRRPRGGAPAAQRAAGYARPGAGDDPRPSAADPRDEGQDGTGRPVDPEQPGASVRDGGQDGTSSTVDPGRAWANAGSATGSTTPTTG